MGGIDQLESVSNFVSLLPPLSSSVQRSPRAPYSMTSVLPPPPRRTVPTASTSRSTSTSAPTKETWKAWSKRKSTVWGQTAMVKGVAISDRWGGKFNGWAGAVSPHLSIHNPQLSC